MAYLSELTEFKRRIANLIVNDEMLVELISGEQGKTLPAADLIGKNVFLYDFVDDTLKDARTLVCLEIDEQDSTSPTARDFELHVYVCVHKSQMNFIDENGRGQIRRDLIASRIDWLLNNRTDLGFQKIKPLRGYRIIFSSDFRTKDMVYLAKWGNAIGEGLDRENPR